MALKIMDSLELLPCPGAPDIIEWTFRLSMGGSLLRVDKNAQFVIMPWTVLSLFTGRYAVKAGRKVFDARWKRAPFDALHVMQKQEPVYLLRSGQRTLWYFHDNFYWDGDALGKEDVKALVLQSERRLRNKVQTARSLMHAEEAGRPTRASIPSDLRRAVFERDGGRCVECNSNFDLQYDHVLPFSLGGATTLENLQLLCAECNSRKSNTL